MKSLSLAFLLLPFSLLAQFSKGDQYLGGSLSINRYNYHTGGTYDNTAKATTLNIGPAYGYFIGENIAIGTRAGYYLSRHKSKSGSSSDNDISKTQKVGFAPTLRKYWTITDRFMFAASANLFYWRDLQKSFLNDDVSSVGKSYELGLAMTPTFVFFPSRHWGIEATLGSLTYTFEKGLNQKWHNHSVNFDYGTFNLGLAYYFRK